MHSNPPPLICITKVLPKDLKQFKPAPVLTLKRGLSRYHADDADPRHPRQRVVQAQTNAQAN